MTTFSVAHPGGAYEVVVGPLGDALGRIDALAAGRRLPLVTDARVFALHGAPLAGRIDGDPILVPEGETAKDWATLAALTEALAARNVKRGTPLIALGGGSVGDVAGLAASLFKRGLPVIHIPTTLLAQADSALGGKTAIDAAGQKNLVGTFHHPALVVADPQALATLDARQLRSGYAEVVKYGLIDDAAFFAWCEAHGAALIAGDVGARRTAVEHALSAKARVVGADPEDRTGIRALLNLGHTFGHAVEALARGELLHGEAIAIGMVLAYRFSAALGLCAEADGTRVAAHLAGIGLPTTLAETEVDRDALLAAMRGDKKATASGMTLILTRGIGAAFVAEAIDEARLAAFLAGAP